MPEKTGSRSRRRKVSDLGQATDDRGEDHRHLPSASDLDR